MLSLFAASVAGQNSERVRVTSLHGKSVLLEGWSLDQDGSLIGSPLGKAEFGAVAASGDEAASEQSRALWRLPIGELWRLEPMKEHGTQKAAARSAAEEGFIQLRSGAQLPAEFLGGAGNIWKMRIGFGSEKSEGAVPYPLLQAMRVEKAPEEDDGGFATALAEPAESRDYLFYWDKERSKLRRMSVLVRGFEDGEFLAERGDRPLRIPRDRVHGIVFSKFGGVDEAAGSGVGRAALELTDGTSLSGRLGPAEQAGHLGLHLFDAIEIELPFEYVRKIEWLSPRMRYVSELEHEILQRVPPLEAQPLLRKDTGLGRPLQLGAERYDRGLLLVPGLHVAFKIPDELRGEGLQLLGKIGMPAAAFGSARVRIFADDELLGEELVLAADGKVRRLGLEPGAAQTLRIEVLPEDDLDAGGRVVFGELRILSKS